MHRAQRLADARLYLVTPARPGGRPLEDVLAPALAGGVDVVQLRDKEAGDGELRAAAAVVRAACDRAGALFILNDRPELVADVGADGVHVGQDDLPVAEARFLAGDGALVGLSTHAPAEVDAACSAQGAARPDYLGVGPVHATPTKPGRPAVGVELVRHAVAAATLPWFAIGGLDERTVPDVLDAGAGRIAVVRAITEAADPEGASRALRDLVPAEPVHG